MTSLIPACVGLMEKLILLVVTLLSSLHMVSTIPRSVVKSEDTSMDILMLFFVIINNDTCFDPQIKTYGVTLTYGNNPRKHI